MLGGRETESCYAQALELVKKLQSVLGETHLITLCAYELCASILSAMGKIFGALLWARKEFLGRLKEYGRFDQDTMSAM